MSSSSSASARHEKYYVPESSSLAVRATIGLILSVFGAALVLNDMTYGSGDEPSASVWVLAVGVVGGRAGKAGEERRLGCAMHRT